MAAATEERVAVRASPEGGRRCRPDRWRGARRDEPGGRRRPRGRERGHRGRDRLALRATRVRRRLRRPVRGRGEPDVARQRGRHRDRARSIVLIGDPNQLPMVTQGVQPGGAAASSLEHLVGEAETMPRDRGLFLETSRRMHPDVNAFISPAFYDGLLETHPDTARRTVDGDDPVLSGSGRPLASRHRTPATGLARARRRRSSPNASPGSSA